jgi:hypothetical protein
MADFLLQCNSGDLKTDPKTFQETWCVRCSQVNCSLAGYAKEDLMAVRNATWRQKFFGAPQADLRIPEFAQIAKLDFPNLVEKAVKLEISERRGDWSVPDVNIPVLDGVIRPASPDTNEQVDEAVRKLMGQREAPPVLDEEETFPVEEQKMEPDPASTYVEQVTSPPSAPTDTVPPRPQKSEQPFMPASTNVPSQEGIMLGGAPRPKTASPAPPEETDPWAAPAKPKVRVIKPGTRIQFGSDGSGKVVDDD